MKHKNCPFFRFSGIFSQVKKTPVTTVMRSAIICVLLRQIEPEIEHQEHLVHHRITGKLKVEKTNTYHQDNP